MQTIDHSPNIDLSTPEYPIRNKAEVARVVADMRRPD